MNDPLAQYRRTSASPAGGVQPPSAGGPNEYLAFGTKDRLVRLKIRRARPLTHSIPYNLLLDVIYDGDFGTNIVLVYTVLTVRVEGRNLQKLVHAVENHTADFFQEFDPEKWSKPADAKAPIIECIEIKIMEGRMPVGELAQ